MNGPELMLLFETSTWVSEYPLYSEGEIQAKDLDGPLNCLVTYVHNISFRASLYIVFPRHFTSHRKCEGVPDSDSHKDSNIFKTFPGQKDL